MITIIILHKVEGVMMDGKSSRKGKGHGLMCSASQYIWLGEVSSVRTATTYVLDGYPLRGNHQCVRFP